MMAVDEQLERLSRRLSAGPIDTVFDEAMSRLSLASAALADWVRQAAYDRPLITLLLSWQVGYLVARLGRRYVSC